MFLRGSSDLMRSVRAQLARASQIACPVLIVGESGTGKSLAAYLLGLARHNQARRVFGVDFELGRPEVAEIIEDVGELGELAQRRLCGWLDDAIDPIATSERVPLEPAVRHRLGGLEIRLPPLRERLGDIDELCEWFGGRATDAMRRHAWPGNVRELRNAVRSRSVIVPRTLRGSSLRDAEAEHIERVLRSVAWNKTQAAKILGIQRSTVYQKIKEHELEPV